MKEIGIWLGIICLPLVYMCVERFFVTYGEVDGEKVEVRIVPRIIKLSDEEIAENIEKARKRNENAIKRINEQIANEKAAILAAKTKITKLQEKLAKLVEKNS